MSIRTFALVVCACGATLRATAVVVFRTPTSIILAADERRTTDAGGPLRPSDGDCKIRRAGRWWFVVGGYSGTDRVGTPGRPDAHVDVFATVAAAVASAPSMAAALAAVGQAFTVTLHDALIEAVTGSSKMYPTGGAMVNVLVAGAGAVGYYGITVKARDPVTLTTLAGLCPGPVCTTGERLFYASSASATGTEVTLMLTTPRPAWLERQDAAAARRVLAEQADENPAEVARPFDVLEISPVGSRWVGREAGSACAEIGPGGGR